MVRRKFSIEQSYDITHWGSDFIFDIQAAQSGNPFGFVCFGA